MAGIAPVQLLGIMQEVGRDGRSGDRVVGNHTRVFGRAGWRIIQFRSPDRRLLARLSRNNGTALE